MRRRDGRGDGRERVGEVVREIGMGDGKAYIL